MNVEILAPGLMTTLQDSGRRGWAQFGIGASGAFDAPAMRLANALCGNAQDACVLEMTLTGVRFRCDADTCIAVTGAPLPIHIEDAMRPLWARLRVPRGTTVTLGAMPAGCRAYLAIRGGFDVAPVFGSRSSDVNAGIGPLDGRPLRAGDVLPVAPSAPRTQSGAASTKWSLDPRPWFDLDPDTPLRLLPGIHLDRLAEISRNALFTNVFLVDTASNRTGLRLTGPALEWAQPLELVSEGCIPGMLQLPPSGAPIAFGPECPVSGGYPRIGQIAAADLPRLAQLRPGAALRFTPCTLAAARAALDAREQALRRLETTIASRLNA